MADVDFGTYHHSTPEESKQIRDCAEKVFSKLLRPLYPSGTRLQILAAAQAFAEGAPQHDDMTLVVLRAA
jgi:serine phosphatase RsbU (regulator of sigma subunit)